MGELTKYLLAVNGIATRQPGWKHNSYEGLLLAEGETWKGGRTERNGEYKMCYSNSAHLAIEKGYLYAEGYATSIIPVMHAWCVDPETNEAIETTWDEPADEYRGIIIPIPTMSRLTFRTERWGVLPNDWLNNHLLLKHGLDGLSR